MLIPTPGRIREQYQSQYDPIAEANQGLSSLLSMIPGPSVVRSVQRRQSNLPEPFTPSQEKTPSAQPRGFMSPIQQSQSLAQSTRQAPQINPMSWEKAKEKAVEIAKKYGIHPSVLLGQMALETGRRIGPGGNMFGIKGTGPAGTKVLATNEATPTGKMYGTQAGFRAYSSPEQSIEDYARLITQTPRYSQAAQLGNDPVKQLQAIKAAGYATDPRYVQKVMSTPEFRQYANQQVLGAQTQQVPRLATQGNQIIRADTKQPIQLNGVTSNTFRFGNGEDVIAHIDKAKQMGANSITLYYSPETIEQNLPLLQEGVKRAQALGLYTILDPVYEQQYFQKRKSQFFKTLDTLSKAFRQDTNVIYGTYAEPYLPDDMDDKALRPHLEKAVQTIRSNDTQAPILWSGNKFGRVIDKPDEIIKKYPNVIFNFHDYPWDKIQEQQKNPQGWKTPQVEFSQKYPTMVGEFGGFTNGDFGTPQDLSYIQKVLDDSIKNKFSTQAYVLDPEGGYTDLGLIDKQGNLTKKGKVFSEHFKKLQTSQPPTAQQQKIPSPGKVQEQTLIEKMKNGLKSFGVPLAGLGIYEQAAQSLGQQMEQAIGRGDFNKIASLYEAMKGETAKPLQAYQAEAYFRQGNLDGAKKVIYSMTDPEYRRTYIDMLSRYADILGQKVKEAAPVVSQIPQAVSSVGSSVALRSILPALFLPTTPAIQGFINPRSQNTAI